MESVESAANQTGASDFVRVVRNADDVGDIADCWRAWCQNPASDMAWCLQEIRSSPESMRPHVLVHYRNGRPNALLVGRCEMKRPDLRIGYFRIPVRKVRCLTFPNGALVGDASATTCKGFLDTIRASLAAGEADAATIYHCELASPIATITRGRAVTGHRFDRRSTAKVLRARMLIDERSSSVIGLSAGERQHQKRRSKMLRELTGDVQIACYRSETEIDRLMKDVEAVAAKTYQRGLGVGFTDTPQMRERFCFEARMGWLRAYVLYIAGRPCAFWISNLYRAVLFSCYLGFDPAYARYSPGAYLMLEVINRLGQEAGGVAVKQIDFGVGEAEYKARFGNRLEQVVSLSMFAPSISGVALGALHTVVEASNTAAARLLTASGLLSRLKRAWRSRLRPPAGNGGKAPV